MNSLIQMMLTYIPPSYDTTPQDIPSLSLSGSGSLVLDDLTLYATGLANLLSPDQAHPTDTLGFVIENPGTTLSYTTSQTYLGGGCLQVACDGTTSEQGWCLPQWKLPACTPGDPYSCITMVLAPAGTPLWLAFDFYNGGSFVGGVDNRFIATGLWQPVSSSIIAPVGSTGMQLSLLTTTSQNAVTFYTDATQINDTSITVSSTVDLHGQLVSQVVDQLPSGIISVVLQDGPAELLLWPNGCNSPQTGSLPATLTIATNPLWQVLSAISREKTTEQRNIQATMSYTNLRTATGMWIDWWAASLGIARFPNEPNSLFILRLVGMTLVPNVNNIAIDQLFTSLGYKVSAVDSGPGQMQVTVYGYPVSQSGFIYSQAQLISIVDQMKAAGVVVSFYLQGPISDSIIVMDTLTATTPAAAWTWGNFVWGQFSW